MVAAGHFPMQKVEIAAITNIHAEHASLTPLRVPLESQTALVVDSALWLSSMTK
jgi:hypothetical protein